MLSTTVPEIYLEERRENFLSSGAQDAMIFLLQADCRHLTVLDVVLYRGFSARRK